MRWQSVVVVATLMAFVGSAFQSREKEAMYVPVPVQQQEEPLEEQREQQEIAE